MGYRAILATSRCPKCWNQEIGERCGLGCQRPSRFWGLGCPKIYHEAEDTLDTYKGPQETFHRRHLVTDYAKKVMQMKCTTCHQGENPREEAPIPPDQTNTRFTLRKQVNPEICLMCHGSFPDYKRMGLPSHWNESREMFQNNCLLCHAGVRTNRHKVNFLKPKAIEAAAKEDSDVCFGCHGGRQWYRISYPYPRHAWKGMSEKIPEWAKGRPTESNPRFLTKQQQAQK